MTEDQMYKIINEVRNTDETGVLLVLTTRWT